MGRKIQIFKKCRFLREKLRNLRIIYVKINVVCNDFNGNNEFLAFFSYKIGKRRFLLVVNRLKFTKKTVNL